MSFFAGLVSRHRAAPLDDADCTALRKALSRHPDEAITEFRSPTIYFAKADLGAFGAPAWSAREDGSLSMLAGQPLLRNSAAAHGNRADDLATLHDGWTRGDDHLLREARGVFCAAHYDPAAERLTLATDKVGVRPIYYWIGEDVVVFATALRILEALTVVPKVADLRGVTELACLGVPLNSRTPYANIRVLRSAEVVRVSGAAVSSSRYWRWDRIAPSTRSEPDLVRAAYDRFSEAVDIRLRGDRTVTAFLSGGLDSRSVIALLRDRGVRVHTFNFSVSETQDRVFAEEFARVAGTVHHEAAMAPEVELRFSSMLSQYLANDSGTARIAPDRPTMTWSGEGGSVGVGHVFQTKAMVDLLRAGARDGAIRVYLDQQKAFVLNRLLQPSVCAALADVPGRGVAEELDDIHTADPGRGIHLFLLLNDQRRHLTTHFENLDLDRMELQTPFYDSDFLQAMIEAPIDLCLGHRFYMKWLAHFPPTVTAVPWQFYPGHVPCPLPVPKGLHYQWQGRVVAAFAGPRRRELLRDAQAMLASRDFPHDALRKRTVRLAAWISRSALGNYDYVLHHASIYYRYWSRSNGRWTLNSAAGG